MAELLYSQDVCGIPIQIIDSRVQSLAFDYLNLQVKYPKFLLEFDLYCFNHVCISGRRQLAILVRYIKSLGKLSHIRTCTQMLLSQKKFLEIVL